MKRLVVCALIACALVIVASLVFANEGGFALPWYRIAGGGGTSADGLRYTLSGTIGQPEAGVLMEGDSFQLSGGYWAGAAPGPPTNALYLPVVIGPG